MIYSYSSHYVYICLEFIARQMLLLFIFRTDCTNVGYRFNGMVNEIIYLWLYILQLKFRYLEGISIYM